MTLPLLLLLAAAPAGALTLDEALARAAAHPHVAGARAGVDQAEARVAEARAGFLPGALATAGLLGTTDNAVPGLGKPREPARNTFYPQASAGLQVVQPIWDFGRTLGQVRSAREVERAAAGDLAGARQDVAVQVRAAFYAVLAAEALLGVADETVGQMEKHLSFARESLGVGRRTRFDVTRAQLDLTNAQIGRITAANGVSAARSALSAAIGSEVGDTRLVRPPISANGALAPAAAVREALARRPEIAAAERRVAAQRRAVEAAEGAWYPVLAASGQASWRGDGSQMAPNWQAGVTLAWPILAGGGDRARILEQEAALRQAVASREELVLRVRAEAEQAALAVAEAASRRTAAELLLVQARENLELAEGRYQSGVGNIIELADAQSALTGARAGAVRAGYDLAVAQARLDRAIGAA